MKTILKFLFLTLVVTPALTAPSANATEAQLLTALTGLENHILNSPALSAAEIAAHKSTIDANESFFGTSTSVMTAAFDLVDTYDTEIAPLWSAGSAISQFDRNALSNEDINWVVYTVMLNIMDFTYTAGNILSHEALLDGKLFATSAHHPGAVAPPAIVTHTATINASYPDTFGWGRQGDELPARKPTGTYAAPGTIVTVTVPSALVNNGFQIRVGCHSWDLEQQNRRWIRRLDRATKVYDITSITMKVANPLGGGIYIEVPPDASEGVVSVDITGAVRSPYFSVKSFHTTTNTEWQNVERNHPAPWADFQTEKFMMQVPTDWIYNLDDPASLMADWDLAADTNNDLMGFPRDRGKETFYMHVDVILRGSAFFPGYPTGNDTYNPDTNYGGLSNHSLVTGPQFAPSYVFHEQGHAYFFKKFAGETESHVNLPHVAIWHQAFGYDLDTAFAASRGDDGNPHRTLDNTAVAWMTSFNFVNGVPMTQVEKQYQLKGHAKFVDIARLFGWQAMNDYHFQLVADNVRNNTGSETDDDLIVRLAIATGVDIRPLVRFWGIHPANAGAVASAIAAEGLGESNEIHDLLSYYRSLIPQDNADFQAFATGWWGGQPDINGFQTESEHAQQWSSYDAGSHAAIAAELDALLALYFPGGDPDPDMDPPTLSGSDIVDDKSGGPISEVETVTYTVTFSEPMNASTVETSDFGNASATGITVASVSPTGEPAVFRVVVMPTGVGTIQLQVVEDAILEDRAGNAMDTTSAITDSTVINVNPPPDVEGELGILDPANANGGINPNTGVPWAAGDQYRLAFYTDDKRDATSTDINDYNDFVNTVADGSVAFPTLGDADWKVLGSTETVSARVNTGTDTNDGIPIFVLDGTTLIAVDSFDMWNGFGDASGNNVRIAAGPVVYAPYLDEEGAGDTGTNHGETVATGTNTNGTTKVDQYLGITTGTINWGSSNANNSGRVWNRFSGSPGDNYSFYALSEPLTIVNSDNSTPPTLTGADIEDDKLGGPVVEFETVTYTVTFSEAMNASTVEDTDFGNASATAITVDSVSPTGNPAVFEVAVTPTEAGTLQLQVVMGAILTDVAGDALDTTSAIADDTIITVNSDNLAPTLAPADIVDDQSGGPVLENQPVTYTVTFSKAMNASTVEATDFGNASATAITVDSVSPTGDPAVFEVVVTPTDAGTLQLQVVMGAILTDVAGNVLDTTSAIADDTNITVDADAVPTVVSFGDDAGGGPVSAGDTVTYIVTFSEAMNAATVGTADFGNAASAAITVDTVSPTGNPAVFQVEVTATGTGTLQLRIAASATLEDPFGNALDAASASPDDTIITVNAAPTMEGELGILKVTANGGVNPNTGNPWQTGDQYRLAFVSRDGVNATSNDPAVYNAFATAQAAAAGLGGNWVALVTVNLDGNTTQALSPKSDPRVLSGTDDQTGGAGIGGAGVPVYAMDGATCIARNNADIWNAWSNPFDGDTVIRIPAGTGAATQNVHYSPFLDQFGGGDSGNVHGVDVWTGSNNNGTSQNPLGDTTDEVRANRGSSNANNTGRIWNRFQADNTVSHHIYALSEPLTVMAAGSDYDAWAALYAGADLTDPNADLDGDGLSNDEERIWGLDPTSASSLNPIAVPLLPTGAFTYTRRDPALSGLTFTVWTSPNLEPGSWTEDTGAIQAPGSPVNEVETVAVTLTASPVEGRLFAQMRAQE